MIGLTDYRIRSLLSIQYVHGDLCKHLGIDSSTDLDDQKIKVALHKFLLIRLLLLEQ